MQQQPPPNSQPLPPVLLPSGWVETWDATQQRNYYYHAETRATQWARPLPAAVPLPPPPPVALPLPPTVNTVQLPQPKVPFDPRRGNNHYQQQGSMNQQQPQPQPQAQYPYPAQVQPQQMPQFYQQPVVQPQHQQQQQHSQYYQQPPHQQQIPYHPPGQPQYPSQQHQQPPLSQQQQQPPPWNNPAPHRIPPQQQQQQPPNHTTTNPVYTYNPAGNAMIRTTPGTAAVFAEVGAPSDPPQLPPPIGTGGTGGTGIYNAQQEFDELRAMTTGQIALLCKLQHEQEPQNIPEENETNEKNETEPKKEETVESASSSATSKAQARYTPIALSSMAYVSLAQHRTEPGRLIALLCKLQHELELHEQNNTPEET